MKHFKKILVATSLMLISATSQADAPQRLEELTSKMNQDYISFAKEWMKLDGFNKTMGFIGMLSGSGTYKDYSEEIIRTFSQRSGDVIKPAINVFTAYCKNVPSRTVIRQQNQVFCINDKDVAVARMQWRIDDRTQNDVLAANQVIFTHQGQQVANNAYQILSSFQPGDTVNTSYGEGVLIEKRENGLMQVQLVRGGTRWITSNDVTFTYKELHQ